MQDSDSWWYWVEYCVSRGAEGTVLERDQIWILFFSTHTQSNSDPAALGHILLVKVGNLIRRTPNLSTWVISVKFGLIWTSFSPNLSGFPVYQFLVIVTMVV